MPQIDRETAVARLLLWYQCHEQPPELSSSPLSTIVPSCLFLLPRGLISKCLEEGLLEEASKHCQQLLSIDPGSILSHVSLFEVSVHEGDTSRGRRTSLLAVVESFPTTDGAIILPHLLFCGFTYSQRLYQASASLSRVQAMDLTSYGNSGSLGISSFHLLTQLPVLWASVLVFEVLSS